MIDPQRMEVAAVVLRGQRTLLEPMHMEHLEDLAAVGLDPAIWRWTPTWPEHTDHLRVWMEQAFEQQAAGKALPFVIRAVADGRIVGATRYMDIDVRNRGLEIGGTWLAPAWQRTGINIEAKYLLLTHAFEALHALRVALKTHHQNLQSQRAIAALGAKQEGIFRNHMIMPDGSLRHTVWYSITAEDWPEVKARLQRRMDRAD